MKTNLRNKITNKYRNKLHKEKITTGVNDLIEINISS